MKKIKNAHDIFKHDKTTTYFFAMGGLDEIGKNMYVIEYDDELAIIDIGIKFANQTMLGMNGLIPNFDYINNFKGDVYLFITHGHEDHIGGAPYLFSKIKRPLKGVYAPLLASELIIKKMGEFKNIPCPKINVITSDVVAKTKHFEVLFFSVCHSIPNSFGICVCTPNGNIVSTGDYRFDFCLKNNYTDIQKIIEIAKRGIDIYLGEATNAETSGFSETELIVIKNVVRLIKKARGRVFLSSFASNLGRISSIIDQANELNRKVCLIGRSMENNIKIARKVGLLKINDLDLISVKEIENVPDNELLVILTGSQGEEKAALNRIALSIHPKITFKPSDTIILSSNPIPGNFLAVENLLNQLSKTGASIYTHGPNYKIHSSGHASSQEQQLMIKLLNPQYIIPIHGEYKMLKALKQTAGKLDFNDSQVLIVVNGEKVALKNRQATITDIKVNASALYIDGKNLTRNSESLVLERKKISSDGIFNVLLVIDVANKKLLYNPAIATRGAFLVKDLIYMISKFSYTIKEEIEIILNRNSNEIDFKEIEKRVNQIASYFIWKSRRVNPLTICTIYKINV